MYFAPTEEKEEPEDNRTAWDPANLPRKLWSTHPDGGIPLISGKQHPTYLSDLEAPPNGQTLDEYVEACLAIAPDVMDLPEPKWRPARWWHFPKGRRRSMFRRLRSGRMIRGARTKLRRSKTYVYDPNKPESEYPEKALNAFKQIFKDREKAVIRRDKAILHLLKAGWRRIRPEDWVSGKKLFNRFLRFYMIVNSGIRDAKNYYRRGDAKGSQRTMAFELWLALGMPSANTLNKTARRKIYYLIQCEYERRGPASIRRAIRMLKGIPDRYRSPGLIWSLIWIERVHHYSLRDQKRIFRHLHEASRDQEWRLRWIFQHYAPKHCPPERGKKKKQPKETTTRRLALPGGRHRTIQVPRGGTRRGFRRFRPRGQWRYVARRRHYGITTRRYSRGLVLRNPGHHLRGEYAPNHSHRNPKERLNWNWLDTLLSLPDVEFIKRFAPANGYAWQMIFGRLPDNPAIAQIPTDAICDLDLGLLIRVMKRLNTDEFYDRYIDEHASHLQDMARNRVRNIEEGIATHERELRELEEEIARQKEPKFRDIVMRDRVKSALRRMRKNLRRNKKELETTSLADYREKVRKKRGIRQNFEMDMGHAGVAMSIIFGEDWHGWIRRMCHQREPALTLHDATHWLPPQKSPGLAKYLREHYTASVEHLETIARRWNDLDADEKEYPVKLLLETIARKRYKDAQSMEFAVEAGKAGVPEDRYPEMEQEWLDAKEVETTIPDVAVVHENLTMRMLSRNDPRGVFAGIHSGCCQHPMGVAKQCAWHGAKSPDGAIYIIEDEENNIVAQSWTWRKKDIIVFDSIESKDKPGQSDRIETFIRLYEQVGLEMLKVDGKIPIKEVRCGSGMRIKCPTRWRRASQVVPMPNDFPPKAYADARKVQYVIVDRAQFVTINLDTNSTASTATVMTVDTQVSGTNFIIPKAS
jgi:hypothetical protein